MTGYLSLRRQVRTTPIPQICNKKHKSPLQKLKLVLKFLVFFPLSTNNILTFVEDFKSIPQPLQVGAYSVSSKIRYGKCLFCFKTLFNWVFSIFSIFPRSSGTYFYDIFDPKLFRPKSSEIIYFKVGRSDPKVGAGIGPKQLPHWKIIENPSKNHVFAFCLRPCRPSRCWK